MKNKKLLVSALIGVSTLAIGAVVGIASSKKSGFRAYANPVEPEWHHYSERMPGVQPGIKEYWVQCGGSYQFTEPQDADIVDVNTWDTTGFAADDDRYTYKCVKKIADSALSNAADDSAPYGLSEGFTKVTGRSYTANDYQAPSLDISNYDYVTFGICHNMEYLCLFGGGSAGSDDPETVIANGNNYVMWQNAWYYFTLEKNAQGEWDAYVGKFATAKRASASLPMVASEKTATNLYDVLRTWNWSIPEGAKIYSTEVYAGEKDQHHYVWDNSKISPVEVGTCAVCGDVTERPASALNFASNKYGAKLINKTAGSDVGDWTSSAFSGTFLNVESATSLSYCYYNWNTFQMYLPRIDFSKYSSVSFDLDSIVRNPGGDSGLTGATDYYKIGFAEGSMQVFASTAAGCVVGGGELSFLTYANKVVAKVSLGSVSELTFDITDANVLNGSESVILYVSCGFNTGSCAIQISNPDFAVKPEAANIADASIKEVQLNKQVRRLEQQDHWKTDADYTNYNNESGHADYFRLGNREAIHFSARYANDDPKFGYNSGWSEWRFTHAVSGVKSVSFLYLFEDSNADTSDDGLGPIHCMAQWYNDNTAISNGSKYLAAVMNLVNDGAWHTMTVTADGSFDITHFVMKVFHFTGDIYISNISYSNEIAPVDAAAITDASVKEVQLNKQVRRLEQQDHWKIDADYATYNNESGHADYAKYGTRDAIHFSAHYDSIIQPKQFAYNSGWSEWRFTHSVTAVASVTFDYCFEDANSDTSDDGLGPIHCMAQWYNDNTAISNGSKYLAATMNLVNDGAWHTITVTADGSFDITHFVMKVFHFTGDIYISNLIYA